MNRIAQAFAERPSLRSGAGEALCVCCNGEVLTSLFGGERNHGESWTDDTMVPVFSATKTASAACFLQALAERGQTPQLHLGELWPRFPAAHCTVEQLLSHQVGLAAWAEPAPMHDLEACRAVVERSKPLWAPPQHGYHPHTLGPMLDIFMIALSGMRIGEFWESRIRRPLGLDFYIGLPESLNQRVATLQAPRVHGSLPDTPFYRAYFDPHSPIGRAFNCVTGLPTPRHMNSHYGLTCACPARGGVASGRALALFYQALLGHIPGGLFAPSVLDWMSRPVTQGWDLTLLRNTSFTCGAMCEPAELFGQGGFGHAGAGGSHAFAEPSTGVSFAYVTNAMQLGILPGERVRSLIAALKH